MQVYNFSLLVCPVRKSKHRSIHFYNLFNIKYASYSTSSTETVITTVFTIFLNQVFKIQHVFTTHFKLSQVCWTGSNWDTGQQSPFIKNYTSVPFNSWIFQNSSLVHGFVLQFHLKVDLQSTKLIKLKYSSLNSMKFSKQKYRASVQSVAMLWN